MNGLVFEWWFENQTIQNPNSKKFGFRIDSEFKCLVFEPPLYNIDVKLNHGSSDGRARDWRMKGPMFKPRLVLWDRLQIFKVFVWIVMFGNNGAIVFPIEFLVKITAQCLPILCYSRFNKTLQVTVLKHLCCLCSYHQFSLSFFSLD